MNIRNVSRTTTGLATLLLLVQAYAAERQPDFEVKSAAGYQYDSNVSLNELDTNTGEGDNALLLEIGIDGSIPVTDALSFNLGYGYTQTTYQEFSEFDTAIHRLQGDVAYRINGFDTGLALRHFAARLDDERFLDIPQVSLSVARLVGKTVYLRGAWTGSQKLYADRAERDATNSAFDIDAYLLLDGMRRYLSFGYRIDSEDAASAELDYDGTRFKFAYGHELDALPLTFKARVQLDSRDYLNVTESIGSQRRDERLRAGVTAGWNLSQHFRLEGEVEYADSRSNLALVDFDEMAYAISLAAEF